MPRRAAVFAALLSLLTLPALARADVPASEPLKGLDDFVARALKEFEVPGLSLAVVKDGKVVLAKG
jgi:CubicO group peptidase (beta-lactamase class C family)